MVVVGALTAGLGSRQAQIISAAASRWEQDSALLASRQAERRGEGGREVERGRKGGAEREQPEGGRRRKGEEEL